MGKDLKYFSLNNEFYNFISVTVIVENVLPVCTFHLHIKQTEIYQE